LGGFIYLFVLVYGCPFDEVRHDDDNYSILFKIQLLVLFFFVGGEFGACLLFYFPWFCLVYVWILDERRGGYAWFPNCAKRKEYKRGGSS
jgi:hypothetical protein